MDSEKTWNGHGVYAEACDCWFIYDLHVTGCELAFWESVPDNERGWLKSEQQAAAYHIRKKLLSSEAETTVEK